MSERRANGGDGGLLTASPCHLQTRRRVVGAITDVNKGARSRPRRSLKAAAVPTAVRLAMIADLGRRLRSLWTSSVLTGGACGEGLSAARMSVDLAKRPKEKVALASLLFGHTFSDHMLTCEWTATHGWQAPRIKPFANLSISPAASALHYAIECFEGMKAYKDKSGTIRLFRPDMNMSRLLSSATRLSLPAFDCDQLLLLIEELLRIDSSWIPDEHGYSLYIRPTMIGTQPTLGVSPPSQAMLFVICSPVGPYYKTGFSAVSLYCEQSIVRAWPGGTGAYKIGAYATEPSSPRHLATFALS